MRASEKLASEQLASEKLASEQLKKPNANSRSNMGRIFYVILVVVGFLLISAASQDLSAIQREDATALSEYDELRELFYMTTEFSGANSIYTTADSRPEERAESRGADQSRAGADIPGPVQHDPFAGLSELNPDFIGWIAIDGTGIDYPVVRGRDNSYYLSATFTGSSNPAGSIFMDHNLERGFDAPLCLLYGHNMRNGSMFAPLNQYLDHAFMEEHPDVYIITTEGVLLVYRVFDARRTDMWDTTYDIDLMVSSFTAVTGYTPGDASRFLLLSTCTPSADRSERMLVYAALVG